MKRVILVMGVLMLLAAVAAAGVVVYALQAHKAAGPLAQERAVLIEAGTGFKAIAAQLEHEGVIADARLFMLPALIDKTHRRVRAGEYAFPAHISGEAVMQKLVDGDVIVRSITVREGLTVREVLALVQGAEAMEGDVPLDVSEGVLLPETYHYTRGMTREDMVAKMSLAREAVLRDAWEKRVDGLPLASPEEALVLASIVEKETGVPEERRMVAGVYVNRLKLGMLLQADPTVAYGVARADAAPERPLTRADLQRDTAYNTYMHAGLPPTPIACAGKASIEAALNPEATDALYFVATGNGGHRFAKTLDEHNQNVAAYRKALRAQQAP